MTNATAIFKQPRPMCLPGKEYGKFARYDKNDGRELVYIGLGEMVMHRDVLDRIEADWAKAFGHGTGSPTA